MAKNSQARNADSRISHYWAVVGLVIVLGVALRIPVVGGTLISDDWDHYAMARGVYPVARSPLDLFKVIAARSDERAALMDRGRLPWWSDPGIRISFLRPLASLATYADYVWFGADREPARAHWHSLLWWCLCLIVFAGMLERVLPRPVALAACALFALDDAHALPVAWAASRAQLIAFAFTIAALWAHIAWCERPRPRLRALAIGLMALGVLAGEHALALFAYVVAFALASPRGTMRERLRDVAPLALPVVLYLGLHAALGYGATGSSFYSDPFTDSARYLQALPGRATLLLGDVVFGFTSEWWFGLPPFWTSLTQTRLLPGTWLIRLGPHGLQLALGIVAGALMLGALARAFRSSDAAAGSLRWLLLGALASLPALCSTFAMTRLTVAPALGVDACLAWLMLRASGRARASGALLPRAGAAALVIAIVLVHGWTAAARSYEGSGFYAAWSRNEEAWVARAALDDAKLGAQHVIVISASDIATQFSLPFIRYRHGKAMPLSSQLLLPPALAPIDVERTGPNALELRSTAPHGHSGFRDSAYRLESDDFRAGQHIAAPNFDVEVLSVEHGTPTALRFVFARALDDASYVFLYPSPDGLKRLALPPAGSMRLPAPAAPAVAAATSGKN